MIRKFFSKTLLILVFVLILAFRPDLFFKGVAIFIVIRVLDLIWRPIRSKLAQTGRLIRPRNKDNQSSDAYVGKKKGGGLKGLSGADFNLYR